MITVASVFKSGDEYDAAYVERLAKAVHRNLGISHRFACLTDIPEEIKRVAGVDEAISLKQGWPTWWSKLELFGLSGPVLYFDLDTVLTGPIDGLAKWILKSENQLMMIRDFYSAAPSSGILGWNGDLKWVLECFITNYATGAVWRRRPSAVYLLSKGEQFRGDQEWLRSFLKRRQVSVTLAQDVAPGIYSYKVHLAGNGKLPTDARIICFHGHPRPHEVAPVPDWMQKHWRTESEEPMDCHVKRAKQEGQRE